MDSDSQIHANRENAQHSTGPTSQEGKAKSLADTEWRLLRIPALEMGIYAVGRIQLAAAFASEPDPQVRTRQFC